MNQLIAPHSPPSSRPAYALPVLIGGLGLFVLAALFLLFTGNDQIRYSADHTGTIPIWSRWVPSLVCLLIAWLIPRENANITPAKLTNARPLWRQTWWLLAAAALFPILLALSGNTDIGYILLKLALLLGLPLLLFWRDSPTARLVSNADQRLRKDLGRWYWLGPLLPTLAWFFLSYATPLALPLSEYVWPDAITLVVTLLAGFLINAVLEEYFYRVWLQSRLELLLGRWPAIIIASLAWAVWHIVIQGDRGVAVDLATVICNQGVQGLFLGYLWSRYRTIWPLLLIHGAVNAAGIIIALF